MAVQGRPIMMPLIEQWYYLLAIDPFFTSHTSESKSPISGNEFATHLSQECIAHVCCARAGNQAHLIFVMHNTCNYSAPLITRVNAQKYADPFIIIIIIIIIISSSLH